MMQTVMTSFHAAQGPQFFIIDFISVYIKDLATVELELDIALLFLIKRLKSETKMKR